VALRVDGMVFASFNVELTQPGAMGEARVSFDKHSLSGVPGTPVEPSDGLRRAYNALTEAVDVSC
jgi:hypothetical protein